MATIRKRVHNDGTTVYHVQIRVKDHPQLTASFDRLVDAKTWADNTENDLRRGKYLPPDTTTRTLHDLLERYKHDILPRKPKVIRTLDQQLTVWDEILGDTPLKDLTPAVISQARDLIARRTTPTGSRVSPATVNRYLAALSHTFTIASQEWEWMTDNPLRRVRKLKEPRGRVRFLDDTERERLLEACEKSENPVLATVVLVGLATGMRRNEILKLRWNEVDLERRRIVLGDPTRTKNQERRQIPLAPPVTEALTKHLEQQQTEGAWRARGLVFPSPTTSSKAYDIETAWQNAKERAGIEDFRFHDLRHCMASYLAMSGATPAEIAEVLGHKTLAMVKRYAHLSDTYTATVVDRMSGKFLEGKKVQEPEPVLEEVEPAKPRTKAPPPKKAVRKAKARKK